MRIKIRDAFGTDIGFAEITWIGPDPGKIQAEAAEALDFESMSVPLATVEPRVFWSLEVIPE